MTTFTTLGYGDLQPLPEMRLAISIEALTGIFSAALAAAVVFLWCLMRWLFSMPIADINRGIGISRVRVRTILGKARKLSKWVLPPKDGELLYYHELRGEWLTATSETEIHDGVTTFRFRVEVETSRRDH